MTGNAAGTSRQVSRGKNTHTGLKHSSLANGKSLKVSQQTNKKEKDPGRKSGIPNGRDDLPAFGGHW